LNTPDISDQGDGDADLDDEIEDSNEGLS